MAVDPLLSGGGDTRRRSAFGGAVAESSSNVGSDSEIERRSRALHAAVAERLRREPASIEEVRARVASWLRDGSVARVSAEQWKQALDGPREALLALLAAPDERAAALRQVSPFAGFLEPRERWRILREQGSGC